MVRLYWWNAWLQSDPATIVVGEPAVETTAHYIDIDPTECRSDKADYLIAHQQANGHNIDNNVGWYEEISLVVSEDELARPLGSGATGFIRTALEAWENARYRWILADTVNGGRLLRVTLREKPARSHPGDVDSFSEFSYKLCGEVFHQNT